MTKLLSLSVIVQIIRYLGVNQLQTDMSILVSEKGFSMKCEKCGGKILKDTLYNEDYCLNCGWYYNPRFLDESLIPSRSGKRFYRDQYGEVIRKEKLI